MRILIVEDEALLADSLKTLLEAENYIIDVAYDGDSGKDYAMLDIYDLIIMDVMMPGKNGYELTKLLRDKHISTPILMLTAKSDLSDRIKGLDYGADYYLTKPFDSRELLACINALLRRNGAELNQLKYGNTILDLSACKLMTDYSSISLSAKEFEVMRMLLQAKSNIISKEQLLTKVWGFDTSATENNVEVYIGFLRKKLTSLHSNLKIEVIRRLGYRLEVTSE